MPFTASVTAGWQRNVARPSDTTLAGLNAGADAVGPIVGGAFWAHRYVDPWMVMGSLFIPVIPTHTDNLAGTAHLIVQPWIGQGVNAFGMTGDSTNVFKFDSNNLGFPQVNPELMKRFGMLAEAQYYFTNQWFLNAAYGVSAAFDVDQSLIRAGGVAGVPQYVYTAGEAAAQMRRQDQVDATLWYRPIAALKFGLQYSYVRLSAWSGLGTPGVAGVFPQFNPHANDSMFFSSMRYYLP
jgi:hypothetical protein